MKQSSPRCKKFHFGKSNVLFRNKFKGKKFMISLRFSFQFPSTSTSESCFVLFSFHLLNAVAVARMWAVKTIPEVFCMFSSYERKFVENYATFIFIFTDSKFSSWTKFVFLCILCNYIWKNNFSSHSLISKVFSPLR